jgi:hypothetical protein
LNDCNHFKGGPLGTFIGGLLLKDTPNSSSGQLHNYVLVISVSLTTQVIAFVLLLILINEKEQNRDNNNVSLVNDEISEQSIRDVNKKIISERDNESCSALILDNKSRDSHKWYL